MEELWREWLSRLRGFRFSLATLLLAIFFVASVVAVWVNREPWEIAAKVKLPEFSQNESLQLNPLAQAGEILIERVHKDHRLTIWNWHADKLTSVEFPAAEMLLETAPAAGRFLTADRSGTARVRQMGSENPLVELPHWIFETAVNPPISPDGNRIATSGPDGAVWLYDIEKQKETSFPAVSTSPAKVNFSFSGDGHLIRVFELGKSGDLERTCVGMQLIRCDLGQRVEIPESEKLRARLAGPGGSSFHGSRNRLFSSNESWVVGSGRFEKLPGLLLASSRDLAEGPLLFDVGTGFEVWSGDLSQRIGSLARSDPGVPVGEESLCLSASGRQLTYFWVLDSNQTTGLWDITTGQLLYTFPEEMIAHRFLDENRILGVDPRKGELQVWRRRRSESAWGLLGLPEFWLVPLFLLATILSFRRDQRRLKGSVAA